jgi:hypothetical protein
MQNVNEISSRVLGYLLFVNPNSLYVVLYLLFFVFLLEENKIYMTHVTRV